jgi:bisphosphoglycerate-dependent phosphoglycerate mutase
MFYNPEDGFAKIRTDYEEEEEKKETETETEEQNPLLPRKSRLTESLQKQINPFRTNDLTSRIFLSFHHQHRLLNGFFVPLRNLFSIYGRGYPQEAGIANNAVFDFHFRLSDDNMCEITMTMVASGDHSENRNKPDRSYYICVEDADTIRTTYRNSTGRETLFRLVPFMKQRTVCPDYEFLQYFGFIRSQDEKKMYFKSRQSLDRNVNYHIILIRHGKASHNIKPSFGFHYKTDTDLVDRDQVKISGQQLNAYLGNDVKIDGVGVSDLSRTHQTAEVFLNELNPELTSELTEITVVPCQYELDGKFKKFSFFPGLQGSGGTDKKEEWQTGRFYTGNTVNTQNQSNCRSKEDYDQLMFTNKYKSYIGLTPIKLCDVLTVHGRNLKLNWNYVKRFYGNNQYRDQILKTYYGTKQKCSENNFFSLFLGYMQLNYRDREEERYRNKRLEEIYLNGLDLTPEQQAENVKKLTLYKNELPLSNNSTLSKGGKKYKSRKRHLHGSREKHYHHSKRKTKNKKR